MRLCEQPKTKCIPKKRNKCNPKKEKKKKGKLVDPQSPILMHGVEQPMLRHARATLHIMSLELACLGIFLTRVSMSVCVCECEGENRYKANYSYTIKKEGCGRGKKSS